MIRILLYASDTCHRSQLPLVTDKILTDFGSCNHAYSRVEKPCDLADMAKRVHPGFFDIIVACIATPQEAGEVFAALKTLRNCGFDASIVIGASSPDLVKQALSVKASGFCQTDDGPDGLKRALAPAAIRALESHSQTIGIRSAAGVCNVRADEIIFAESSKKGSIIHMADGSTPLVRTTLQALFTRLEGTSAFVKAGSSFIVNLANVRLADNGAVIFSDGESIIIPVRARKPFKDTLETYWRNGILPQVAPVQA